MSYYWFNKQELLQKAKEKYDNCGKEKAAKYYQVNKDLLFNKSYFDSVTDLRVFRPLFEKFYSRKF